MCFELCELNNQALRTANYGRDEQPNHLNEAVSGSLQLRYFNPEERADLDDELFRWHSLREVLLQQFNADEPRQDTAER